VPQQQALLRVTGQQQKALKMVITTGPSEEKDIHTYIFTTAATRILTYEDTVAMCRC
jgi:hypothetical protein